MDDASELNLADTYVLDDSAIKRTDSMGMTGILSDVEDAEMADTFVLDESEIREAENLGMTGILKDLDDEAIAELENDDSPAAGASGYTIELSLDDDD